jgi:hypothetical protein
MASIGMAAISLAPQKPAAGEAPRHEMVFVPRTDLSGEWVQVGATYNGAGRGGGDGRMISITSGAALNCGTTCTIVQNGSTLTLTRPDQPGQTPPDSGTVVLNTDGSDSTIALRSGGEFKATARWEGDTLVVTRQVSASNSVTQTVSIENGRLEVVSQFTLQDAPVTMTYEKK